MYFLLDTCQHPTVLRIIYFGYLFWEILAVVIPIGLIIMLMVDFTKSVITNKEDEQIKNMKLVGKRIMYAIFIFATPWLVSFIMNVLGDAGVKIGGDYTLCINRVKNISAGTESIETYDEMLEIEENIEEEERKKNQNNSVGGNNTGSSGKVSSGNAFVDAAEELLKSAKGERCHKGGNKYSGSANSVPWCASFVNWNLNRVKIDGIGTIKEYIEKEIRIENTASAGCPIAVFNASSHLEFHYSKHYGENYTPKKGDLIFFRYQKAGEAIWDGIIDSCSNMFYETSHIGIVDYVADNMVYTVEGNTYEYDCCIVEPCNSGSASNVVGRKSYNLDNNSIMGYGSWYKA